jgi:hypothetical protein
VGEGGRALGALAEVGPYERRPRTFSTHTGPADNKEQSMSIVTILIIVVLVLLALYLLRRVV